MATIIHLNWRFWPFLLLHMILKNTNSKRITRSIQTKSLWISFSKLTFQIFILWNVVNIYHLNGSLMTQILKSLTFVNTYLSQRLFGNCGSTVKTFERRKTQIVRGRCYVQYSVTCSLHFNLSNMGDGGSKIELKKIWNYFFNHLIFWTFFKTFTTLPPTTLPWSWRFFPEFMPVL